MNQIPFIVLIIVIADAVATVSGFGLATVLTPVLSQFMSFTQVLWLVAILHWCSSIWKVVLFYNRINISVALLFGLPAILTSFFGALLVGKLVSPEFAMVFGIFLILYALVLLIFPNWSLSPSKLSVISGGLISGVCAGIFGIRGAVNSFFLSAFNMPKEVYISTIGLIGFLEDSARLIGYLWQGFGGGIPGFWIGIFIGATFAGAFIGRLFVNHISQQTFRTCIALFLLIVGLQYLIFGMPGM